MGEEHSARSPMENTAEGRWEVSATPVKGSAAREVACSPPSTTELRWRAKGRRRRDYAITAPSPEKPTGLVVSTKERGGSALIP